MSRRNEDGVILELVHIGRYVKVSAIDTKSGTEVSIVGDPAQGEAALQRVAIRKLQYVMNKNADKGSPSGGGRLV
ncbi:MAG: DUF6898 family protein [Alphaproteobacteria bacterium]|jgi:hypothetical protein